MASLLQLLGLQPRITEGGNYQPSKLGLWSANVIVPKYKPVDYPDSSSKSIKVMLVCTEANELVMANGKRFLTGNHPVEMFVPILHMERAGFEIEIFTPHGKPVAIEMWAMPKNDPAVTQAYQRYQSKLNNPRSLRDSLQEQPDFVNQYSAVYLPGGHGAMVGLPDSEALGQALSQIILKDKFLLTICHGPAGLMSMLKANETQPFPLTGYKMTMFPDWMDRMVALLGYLPGKMPWFLGESLQRQGLKVKFSLGLGCCIQDRKVISGDGPAAANKLGVKAVHALIGAQAGNH